MKSPISELDYGKELFGQNLPDRRYNPNWKKLIPNEEPNTDDENKALTLLKKWYDDEKSPAELTKLFGELLKLKSKFPNVLNPTMGRSEYENNDFFRGTLLPLSHLIKLGGWKKYDGLDFDGAIQTKSSYVWKPKSSKGFTSVTPTADLALNFALDYAWKGIKGMWERNILKSLQGKGDTLVPVILVFKDTHPNMIMNPIFSNLLSANVESEVILVGKSSKPSYIIVPNFDVVQQEAEEENIKLHNYFKGLKENTMKSSDKQLNESFYNEFVSQFMSEVMEDEGGSNEIKVGEYQTKYFHVCPGAISLYKDIESKGVDMGMAQRSAMLQDALYFVEKHIQRDGYNPEKDYVMVAKNLAKNIMKLAEMMGLEEEHNYIQGHVDTIEKVVKEKGLEERVLELTEENVPTDPSKWSYYKSQAKKKFDVYPSAYANAWAAKQYKAAGGGWKTKKKESVNEHRWAIDLSEDFLNEWTHPPGFLYKSKAEGMSTDDLIKLSKKQGMGGEKVRLERPDLQSQIKSTIKTFFEKGDPFAMKEQFGKTFKLTRIEYIWEFYHILEDTPKKKGSKDGIHTFFEGELSSPLGKSKQTFSLRIPYRQKGKSQAYVGWYSDAHGEEWHFKVKDSKKVWDYYKEAYLAIPDNPEDDKRFVMNRKGVGKVSKFGKYKEIPKSFVSKIMEDPVLWLGFEGVPEFGSPGEIKEIFNTLNKKYYKQWQAANRTGTKGALRNVKAWFTSLREHEEYSGITTSNKQAVNEFRRTPLKILYSYFRDNLKDTIVMVTSVDGNMITVQSKDNINYGVSVNQFKKLVKNGDWVKLKDTKAAEKLFKESVNENNDPIISNWRKELIDRINKQKKLTPKQKKDLLNKANKAKSGLDFEEIHIELDNINESVNEGLNKSDIQYQLQIAHSGNTPPKVTKLNKKKLEVRYPYRVNSEYVIAQLKMLYPEVEFKYAGWGNIPSGGGIHSFDIKESVVTEKQIRKNESVNEANTFTDKWEKEEAEFKRIIASPDKRVYDLVDYVQFSTGGMTEKDWEKFMYGRYKKNLQSTDSKTKEKMYKVLQKMVLESVNEAKVSSEDKAYFKKHKKEIMKMIEDDLLLDPVEAIKLHKQKNEATAAEEDEFHTKLDKLVHKTFGKSSDEKDESKNEVVDEYDVETIEEMKDFQNFIKEYKADINEAEYQGRDVKLGKIMQGDVKKFKVYVKNDKGNVVKVNFGQKGMTIKKDNPGARKSFRSRMNCDSPGPRWKARYWSCRKW
jgi:hypothetical protein